MVQDKGLDISKHKSLQFALIAPNSPNASEAAESSFKGDLLCKIHIFPIFVNLFGSQLLLKAAQKLKKHTHIHSQVFCNKFMFFDVWKTICFKNLHSLMSQVSRLCPLLQQTQQSLDCYLATLVELQHIWSADFTSLCGV